MAQVSRFWSSRVSTRSVFQIILRSLMPTLTNRLSTSVIFLTPSWRDSSVRKTETSLNQLVFGRRIRLHNLLHVETDFSSRFGSVGLSEFVEIGNRSSSQICGDRFVRFAFLESFLNVMSACSSEDNDIEERVCAKTICTVDTDTSSFSGRV